MSTNPDNLRYSAEHEWINGESPASVGITRHAADALGEVVYVDLPSVGDTVTAGESCGEIESTKSVSELYAPVSGTIIEVNEALEDEPGLVNEDPYANWLYKVEVDSEGPLMSAAEYEAQL